jgi:hypothetical protein
MLFSRSRSLQRDYLSHPDFLLKKGDIWRHLDLDSINQIPTDSQATQVSAAKMTVSIIPVSFA